MFTVRRLATQQASDDDYQTSLLGALHYFIAFGTSLLFCFKTVMWCSKSSNRKLVNGPSIFVTTRRRISQASNFCTSAQKPS
jgi:hypothetical protein